MMDNPAREGGHSLKSWGERLGSAKIEFEDFSKYTAEMLEYCKQDVKLCSQVYNYLQHTLQDFSPRSVSDEHRMRIVADRISHNGFALDKDKAVLLYNSLVIEQEQIEKECRNLFPTIVEERYSEKTGKRLKDRVIEFNPSSRQQIAESLIKL